MRKTKLVATRNARRDRPSGPCPRERGLATIYRSSIRFLFGHRTCFRARVGSAEASFATDDDYSRCWFYPRYAWGRIHERPVTREILRALQGFGCFADVGANLGWYTCLAAAAMPGGKVFGFEMDDLNFAVLERNVVLNQFRNVSLHKVAISDRAGRISYHRPSVQPSPVFRLAGEGEPAEEHDRRPSVDSVTLDMFFRDRPEKPEVIKIDVEGAELKVLEGMTNLLRECHPVLFVEVHPQVLANYHASVKDVLALLADHHYGVEEFRGFRADRGGQGFRPLSPDEGTLVRRNTMLHAVRM